MVKEKDLKRPVQGQLYKHKKSVRFDKVYRIGRFGYASELWVFLTDSKNKKVIAKLANFFKRYEEILTPTFKNND